MDLEKMRADLAYLERCLQDIDTRAGDRALNDDEQRSWDEGLNEVQRLRAQILRVEERQAEVRRLATAPAHVEPGQDIDVLVEGRGVGYRGRGSSPWDLDAVTRSLHASAPETGGRDLSARALDAVEHMQGVPARAKEHMTQLLESMDLEGDDEPSRGARKVAAHIIAASSPEYMRAWSKALRTGMRTGQPDMAALGVLQRAASLTDAQGGYAVPVPIDPTLIVNTDGNVNPLRAISTVRTVTTPKIEVINVGAVTASYDAEASEVSDDTPTWGNQEINTHTARAFIPYSIEIGMDYPGFQEDIRMLLAEAKNDLEAQKFLLGSGSGEPTGIVTALTGTAYEVASDTADVFALADVYALDAALPARWSANASWLANNATYSAIRQAGGANLDDFWVGLRDGRPSQLLGHTPYEASYMDGTIDAAANNRVMILGDFRWFWIVDRAGFSMELVPHLFHTANNRPSGQRGVFAWWRNGSDSVQDRAFRMLNV